MSCIGGAPLIHYSGTVDPVGSPLAGTVAAWRSLFAGATAGARERVAAVLPATGGAARLAVELMVIDALAASAEGDHKAAAVGARKALIRAQAEAAEWPERLAALTLARVRRRAGRPHLAMHVLTALAGVRGGAGRLQGWLEWETLLAGGPRAFSDGSAIAPAPSAAAALMRAAEAGQRDAFEAAWTALARATAGIADAAQEAEALAACLDPGRSCALAPVLAWRRGDGGTTPYGLDAVGWLRGSESDTERATAFVIAAPGAAGVRVLWPGVPLSGAALIDSPVVDGAGPRTDMGLAALALAGPAGLSRPEFFERVYSFGYGERHRGVLDVLLHRMRERLGSRGRISWNAGDGALVLEPDRPLALPDPRCTRSPADRVLWAIARHGASRAQDAAEALRMPLRTVQALLRQLVDEGVCQTSRAGSSVRYEVRETTFTSLVVGVPGEPGA